MYEEFDSFVNGVYNKTFLRRIIFSFGLNLPYKPIVLALFTEYCPDLCGGKQITGILLKQLLFFIPDANFHLLRIVLFTQTTSECDSIILFRI